MKVAIVHEWLVSVAGSEKVLGEMLKLWPKADLFAVVDFLGADQRATLSGRTARTTFIQRMPGAKRFYQMYLPLMPIAIEQLDLSAYDVILSSSHAVAKGVITGPDQLHISYVHSPIRYAYDFQHQYLLDGGMGRGVKGLLARLVLHYIRLWDQRSAMGVDHFIANSEFIGRRIKKAYRRDSVVIYPPVDTTSFSFVGQKEEFYFTASRMVPYKKIPMIVQAFAAMPSKRLIVIGDGPDFEIAKSLATSNISLLGYQSNEVLISHMQRAKAFIFAAEEDFGIAPVESQACGTPVIAFGKGGALETVNGFQSSKPTGVFYREQTSESLQQAIEIFENNVTQFLPSHCRENAERFSIQNFRSSLAAFVEERIADSEFISLSDRADG